MVSKGGAMMEQTSGTQTAMVGEMDLRESRAHSRRLENYERARSAIEIRLASFAPELSPQEVSEWLSDWTKFYRKYEGCLQSRGVQ
jgi:uncharacterized membrane protein